MMAGAPGANVAVPSRSPSIRAMAFLPSRRTYTASAMSPSTRRTSPEPFGVVTVSVPERRSVDEHDEEIGERRVLERVRGRREARVTGARAGLARALESCSMRVTMRSMSSRRTRLSFVDLALALAGVVQHEERRDLRELDAQRVDDAHRTVFGLGDGARGEDDVVAAAASSLARHLRAVRERDADAPLTKLRRELRERVDVVIDEEDATTRHRRSRRPECAA